MFEDYFGHCSICIVMCRDDRPGRPWKSTDAKEYHIIDDILYIKIKSGQMEFENIPFGLYSFLCAVQALMKKRALTINEEIF